MLDNNPDHVVKKAMREVAARREAERLARVTRIKAELAQECASRGVTLLSDPEDKDTLCEMSHHCKEGTFLASLASLQQLRNGACPRCYAAARADARFERVYQKSAEEGWIMREEWAGSYNTPIHLTCEYGHPFSIRYAHLHSRGCPTCSGKDPAAAEARIAEIAAERGWRLDQYGGAKDASLFKTPRGDVEVRRTQFMQYPDVTQNTISRVAWGDKSWLFIGIVPGDLPKEVAKLFRYGKVELLDTGDSKRDTIAKFRSIMGTLQQRIMLLNVWENSHNNGGQWVSPGVYTWGKVKPFAPIKVTPQKES